MMGNRKSYRTQWSAQFFAAAELTRRGYLVSLTLGNAPVVDLMVVSPNGEHFMVDVKGLSSKNFWLIQEREPRVDLFYILVYLSPDLKPPNYFILPSKEIMNEIDAMRKRTIESGKVWTGVGTGINWGTSLAYENRWDFFPV